jgi:hypothetical protein
MAASVNQFARWLSGDSSPQDQQKVEESLDLSAAGLARSLQRIETIIARCCPALAPSLDRGDEQFRSWVQGELAQVLADARTDERFLILNSNRALVNEVFLRFVPTEWFGQVTRRDFFQTVGQTVRICFVEQAHREIRNRQPPTRTETAGKEGKTQEETIQSSVETLLEQRPTVAFSRAYPEAALVWDKKWAKLCADCPEVYEVYALGKLAGRTESEVAELLGLPEEKVANGWLLAETLMKEPVAQPADR